MLLIQKESNLKYIKKLYYARGLSVPEIAKKMNLSLGAIYSLMRKYNLKRRGYSEQNRIRFAKNPPSFNVISRLSPKDKELRTAGIMLYWAEGYQSEVANHVDFSNSRPEIILIFLKFLREVCGVNELKLRSHLYCYSNQNVDDLIRFWSKVTMVPIDQFTKPYVRKDFNPKKMNKMRYGLLYIRYNDKKLLDLIRVWIKNFVKEYGMGVGSEAAKRVTL